MKKIPLRKCLGCQASKPKNELIRIVKTKDGEIDVDKTGKKTGRGAYICLNKDCFEKAKREKRLEREFETKISEDVYNTLLNNIK